MEVQVGTNLELESNIYTITEWIDDGGNGTVWKAEVKGDSCVYAVKFLNNGNDKNKVKLTRFERECQFCKDANHKHIIKIFDYVTEKGKAFCVMPYYSRNLRSIIAEEKIHLYCWTTLFSCAKLFGLFIIIVLVLFIGI